MHYANKRQNVTPGIQQLLLSVLYHLNGEKTIFIQNVMISNIKHILFLDSFMKAGQLPQIKTTDKVPLHTAYIFTVGMVCHVKATHSV